MSEAFTSSSRGKKEIWRIARERETVIDYVLFKSFISFSSLAVEKRERMKRNKKELAVAVLY